MPQNAASLARRRRRSRRHSESLAPPGGSGRNLSWRLIRCGASLRLTSLRRDPEVPVRRGGGWVRGPRRGSAAFFKGLRRLCRYCVRPKALGGGMAGGRSYTWSPHRALGGRSWCPAGFRVELGAKAGVPDTRGLLQRACSGARHFPRAPLRATARRGNPATFLLWRQ